MAEALFHAVIPGPSPCRSLGLIILHHLWRKSEGWRDGGRRERVGSPRRVLEVVLETVLITLDNIPLARLSHMAPSDFKQDWAMECSGRRGNQLLVW